MLGNGSVWIVAAPRIISSVIATPVSIIPVKLSNSSLDPSPAVNGHSDVVGGVVIINTDELNAQLRFLQNSMGGVPGPMDCYLAMRGWCMLTVG